MTTKVIIIAAGDATRWQNFLGVPKHLIPIKGEPILYRTVRLLKENNITDISIVSPQDDRYDIPGTHFFVPVKNPKHYGVDKFINSKELWNKKGKTIIIYGDCYYTEEAIKTIVSYEEKQWNIFCRFGASTFTECPYGEIFAFSFYPEHHKEFLEKFLYIVELCDSKKIFKSGGWQFYRAMMGAKGEQIDRHKQYSIGIEINDFTDDFDYPDDYLKFLKKFK